MITASSWSQQTDAALAVNEAAGRLIQRLGRQPNFIVAQHTVALPTQVVAEALAAHFPGVPIHGGTSCQGVMTEAGFMGAGPTLGLFGLYDPDGTYGIGSADMGNDPTAAAMSATEKALAMANRSGERPEMIWLTCAPGHEEQILSGLRLLVGPGVPVAGGSSGDDSISGAWSQFAGIQVHSSGVVISVMFPSCELSFPFHSGYDPTQHHGIVTKASGRTIHEIDQQPAAVVYDRWTGGLINKVRPSGGTILGLTTLHPLGRIVERLGGIPYFLLSHPDTVTVGGDLTLFTNVSEGDQLVLMQGSEESLVARAGRVVRSALVRNDQPVAGALVIYCAGCMLTVQSRMDEVASNIHRSLDGKPFLGCFTFGEQGCLPGGFNHHGNLMISVLVFHS